MRLQVDTPNPEMTDEEREQLDRNNIKAIQQTVNKTGVQILANLVANTATSATGAVDSKIRIGNVTFEAVVSCSGGMVEFDFYTTSEMDSGGSALDVKLWIDNEQKAISSIGATAPVAGFVAIRYKEKLGAGRHLVYVTATATGTNNLSFRSSDTKLLVSETLL